MLDLVNVFKTHPMKYDTLVSKEDYANNLLQKILEITGLNKNSIIVDMGTGTGRIAFLLSNYANKVFAFDKTIEMIHVAEERKKRDKVKNIVFSVADNTKIPLSDGFADLSIEGWAFLAMRLFSEMDPILLIKSAIIEMERITKKGGYITIIETQGTCVDSPIFEEMIQLKVLTDELGFSKKIISTDYKFDSIDQACDLIDFFFGFEAKAWVKKNQSEIVKEYTGIWWKKV